MANGNGNGWILKTVIGFLWMIIFFAITFMGKSIIANDKDGRDRDTMLETKVNRVVVEQLAVNQSILITLKEIQTVQGYIRKQVEDNGR